jgi:hypothetical protein
MYQYILDKYTTAIDYEDELPLWMGQISDNFSEFNNNIKWLRTTD